MFYCLQLSSFSGVFTALEFSKVASCLHQSTHRSLRLGSLLSGRWRGQVELTIFVLLVLMLDGSTSSVPIEPSIKLVLHGQA